MEFYITIFVVAVMSGVVAGAIADSKGREVGGFFLLGFLIPLVGILAAVLSGPSDAKKREDRAHADAQLVKKGRLRECPHCFSKIDGRASVCPQCQRDVQPIAAIRRDLGHRFDGTGRCVMCGSKYEWVEANAFPCPKRVKA